VLAPPEGAVAGVDVRGAAPGTRETDLLDPRRLVRRVNAVLLTGGSAYGLAAADGVMRGLESDGWGYPLGRGPGPAAPERIVPIVPAAVVFDLGRGGDFGRPPGRRHRAGRVSGRVRAGWIGPGGRRRGRGRYRGGGRRAQGRRGQRQRGALQRRHGGRPGGAQRGRVGGASADRGALRRQVRLGSGAEAEFAALRPPDPTELAAALDAGLLRSALDGPLRATTLSVLGTDARLSKAECALLAGMGADGLARAVRPVHTMVDGDTTLALSTGARPAPELADLHELLAAGADCVSRAIVYAVLAAESVRTPAGTWPAYTALLPSTHP